MTEGRKIYCKPCGKYLGIIRNATLHKEIVFLCKNCDTKRIASDMVNKTNKINRKNSLDDIFGKGVF